MVPFRETDQLGLRSVSHPQYLSHDLPLPLVLEYLGGPVFGIRTRSIRTTRVNDHKWARVGGGVHSLSS